MADWKIKGQYLKNCSCVSTCPCDIIGLPTPNNFCEGILGMHIETGYFDNVNLSGIKWVLAVHFPGPLHEGNGLEEIFVDESASQTQRDAMLTILSGHAGGTYFELLSQIITTIHGPHFVKIDWEFDKKKRRARVHIPNFIETSSEPLGIFPLTSQEQRMIVQLPGSFEYKEMEVAKTVVLKGSGAIKFDWQGTFSSLATVEHTPTGLVK